MRHRIGFGSYSERLAFYLQINPVVNILFGRWFCYTINRQSVAGRVSRWLLDHGVAYGALRCMSPEVRTKFTTKVLGLTAREDAKASGTVSDIVNSIHEQGFLKIAGLISLKTVQNAKDYFGSRVHYNAQIYAQSNGAPIKKDWRSYETYSHDRYICFHRDDSLRFLTSESGIDLEFLKRIADAYCGFDTHLYGVNTMCTFPGEGIGYAMRLHRDYDDFSFLTFFISWTKTAENDGATLYVPRSHKFSDAVLKTVALSAEPGDLVAVDTFGIHAGNAEVKQARLATWIRFGHKINLATIQDGC